MRKIIAIILIVVCCSFSSCAKANIPGVSDLQDENTLTPQKTSLISEIGIESISIAVANYEDISNSPYGRIEYYYPIDEYHIRNILEYLNSFLLLKTECPKPFLESTATRFEITYNNGASIYLRSIENYIGIKSGDKEQWYEIIESKLLPDSFVKTLERPVWYVSPEDDMDISGIIISVNVENGKIKFPTKQIKYISVLYSGGIGNGTEIKYWNESDCNSIKNAIEAIDLGIGQEIEPYINLGGIIPKIRIVFEDDTCMKIAIVNTEFHFGNKSYDIQDPEQLSALKDLLQFCNHK